MIKDILSKIETAIDKMNRKGGADAAALAKLLAELKTELQALPESRLEEARSIANFTEAAAHEVSRADKSVHLRNLSTSGIAYAVKGFEASHPRLVELSNQICLALSRMGI